MKRLYINFSVPNLRISNTYILINWTHLVAERNLTSHEAIDLTSEVSFDVQDSHCSCSSFSVFSTSKQSNSRLACQLPWILSLDAVEVRRSRIWVAKWFLHRREASFLVGNFIEKQETFKMKHRKGVARTSLSYWYALLTYARQVSLESYGHKLSRTCIEIMPW